MALSMALCGAKNKTSTQLKHLSNEKIFEINKNYLESLARLNKSGYVINVINKLYSKKGLNLNQEFIDNLHKFYDSELELLDFNNPYESAKLINEFLVKKTDNKIQNLIDPYIINDLTKLLLLNATYFKGKWLNHFPQKQTYQEDFYLKDGSTVKVDMMKLLNKDFLYKINPGGITALTCEIPYVGDSLSMTLILPHEGISLEEVEAQLTSDVLKQIMYYNKNMYVGKVNIYLPKFKLDFKEEVINFLV